jgi:hypothetical protein
MILVVWKYAKMPKTTPDTFLTASEVQNIFFEKSFWWSGSMRKCIKTRF